MSENIEIFPWSENFETGLEEIDHQHQRLVGLINVLVGHLAFRLEAPSIECLIDELRDYSHVHFSYEEELWGRYFAQDPWLLSHQSSHSGFVEKINEIRKNESGKPYDEVIEEMATFLTHWLALHIIETDKRMAKAVIAMSRGLSLQRAKELANEEMSGATRILIDTVMGMYDNLAHKTIVLAREIQARKKSEAALQLAQESLLRLKEEAEQREVLALADIRNFGEVLSHHIQEAVRAQLIFTSQLKKLVGLNTPPDKEIDFALGEVTRGAERLRSLLRDLEVHLSLSGTNWTPRRVCLGDIVQTASRRLSAKIREKGARIDCDDLPCAMLDVARMSDVLTALIDNSVCYGRDRVPVVVRIRAAVNRGCLHIDVDDNGVGIAEEYRDRAFRIFERFGAEQNPSGTGIGLALVKKVMDTVGGAVVLDTSPLGGTRVSLTIPLPEAR